MSCSHDPADDRGSASLTLEIGRWTPGVSRRPCPAGRARRAGRPPAARSRALDRHASARRDARPDADDRVGPPAALSSMYGTMRAGMSSTIGSVASQSRSREGRRGGGGRRCVETHSLRSAMAMFRTIDLLSRLDPGQPGRRTTRVGRRPRDRRAVRLRQPGYLGSRPVALRPRLATGVPCSVACGPATGDGVTRGDRHAGRTVPRRTTRPMAVRPFGRDACTSVRTWTPPCPHRSAEAIPSMVPRRPRASRARTGSTGAPARHAPDRHRRTDQQDRPGTGHRRRWSRRVDQLPYSQSV